MTLPTADTPLYSHPLPELERWLHQLGFTQDRQARHCWQMEQAQWNAEICLDTEEMIVRYFPQQPEREVIRSFKYSLSRSDVEAAILEGP